MEPNNKLNNPIVKQTFDFSLKAIEYCEELDSRRKFVLSNQLLKSACSIGANVWEAQNAESKADFIHKFKIAAKEVDESKYWIMLCKLSQNYPDPTCLIERLKSISKIITTIISTSKKLK